MKLVVCVKPTAAGDLNPFDASAYEAALRIPNASVTLLAMAPATRRELLSELMRLGAEQAVLLSDAAFAGADTLATAYTLWLAIKQLQPDFVFCGRVSLDGDTAQVGPALAAAWGASLATCTMSLQVEGEQLVCTARDGSQRTVGAPGVVTFERMNTLRLPGLRSKPGKVTVLSADDLQADRQRIGLTGSPTRVLASSENEAGKRHCRFLEPRQFDTVLAEALALTGQPKQEAVCLPPERQLAKVWTVGKSPLAYANTISKDIRVIKPESAEKIEQLIRLEKPSVVLWGSDAYSKETAPQVAWRLQTGLCADCTRLDSKDGRLLMVRPALSGHILATIVCLSDPQMATVRTPDSSMPPLFFAFGKGAADSMGAIEPLCERYGAVPAASRGAVDAGLFAYEYQVGLTGKTVCPSVYVAFGISGAVHHIEGMKTAGTVIAVNPDRNAAIFEYADYGFVMSMEEFLPSIGMKNPSS